MLKIEDIYPNINADTATKLADHIDDLVQDLERNKAKWENVTLDRYLEALAAVFRDHQPHLLKGHETGSVPYGVLAHLLQAATIYE